MAGVIRGGLTTLAAKNQEGAERKKKGLDLTVPHKQPPVRTNPDLESVGEEIQATRSPAKGEPELGFRGYPSAEFKLDSIHTRH